MKIRAGLISEALIVLLALPASIIANRILGPNDRGTLALILTYSSLVASIVSLQWERNVKISIANGILNSTEILGKTEKVLPVMSIFGVLIILSIAIFDNSLSNSLKILTVFSSLVLIPLPIYGQVLLNILLGLGLPHKYYKAKIIGQFFYLGLTLFFYSIDFLNVITAITSVFGLWIAVTLLSWIEVRSNCQFFSGDSSKKIRIIDIGGVTNLIDIFSLHLPVVIAAMMLGHEIAGVFAAFKIFEMPFQILFSAITNISLKKQGESREIISLKLIAKKNFFWIGVGFVLFISFELMSENLIYFILGDKYSSYSSYAAVFVVSGMLSGVGVLLSQFLQINKNILYFYKLQVYDGITKIIIILTLSYFFGVTGFFLGYATLGFVRAFLAAIFLMEKVNE